MCQTQGYTEIRRGKHLTSLLDEPQFDGGKTQEEIISILVLIEV